MKHRRPSWLDQPARNPFRLLRPSQRTIARARKAGVHPLTVERIREWQADGEPEPAE